MRKVTQDICNAFENRTPRTCGNSHTNGTTLYLHGNAIAEHRHDGLWVTSAGWQTVTTKERLNGLHGVNIYQKDYEWFLNGKKWDGEWVHVESHKDEPKKVIFEDDARVYVVAE